MLLPLSSGGSLRLWEDTWLAVCHLAGLEAESEPKCGSPDPCRLFCLPRAGSVDFCTGPAEWAFRISFGR